VESKLNGGCESRKIMRPEGEKFKHVKRRRRMQDKNKKELTQRNKRHSCLKHMRVIDPVYDDDPEAALEETPRFQ
jgi:hypothetical protein